MKAEIITVGSELLLGHLADTNAVYLAQNLARLGIDLAYKSTVGDKKRDLEDALQTALKRADIIITTGGLGPTLDDITREAICESLGLELVLRRELEDRIRWFFKSRGRPMPESNLRLAHLPKEAMALDNPVGTAPGFIIEKAGKIIVALPGPPAELCPMFEQSVIPFLKDKKIGGQEIIKTRILKTCGLGESSLEEKVRDIITETNNPTISTLVHPGEVHLVITAKAATEAEANERIKGTEDKLRRRIGEYIFGADEDTLEAVVGKFLREKGLTLGIAESCTGGLVSDRMTNVSGSSDYFMGTVVSYSNEAKIKMLGVPEEIIRTKGAVSEECAVAMAKGVREVLGTDLGLSITGIAGPTGGTPEKPVGLVYIALASAGETICEEYRFAGTRLQIKYHSSQAALNMIRKYLISK